MGKCIAGFKNVKVLISYVVDRSALHFGNLTIFLLCMCKKYTSKSVMFVIGIMKPVSFSFFLDAFSP